MSTFYLSNFTLSFYSDSVNGCNQQVVRNPFKDDAGDMW